jgi:hypothetical protein
MRPDDTEPGRALPFRHHPSEIFCYRISPLKVYYQSVSVDYLLWETLPTKGRSEWLYALLCRLS